MTAATLLPPAPPAPKDVVPDLIWIYCDRRWSHNGFLVTKCYAKALRMSRDPNFEVHAFQKRRSMR